ncbi:MAG: hypothetical protein CMA27_04880 [Euryarchaeota archaeon]|nr:hypothetical protein [Euryarchaeota archaeon]|tara:strand:- start:831 stop:1340 length:510 start_codon:yes stop_codon:yes gene_type:complete
MNIETAANLGEMLGGLAILFTLIFGARQIKQWNETVKINSARDVANHLSSPLIQYAIVLLVNVIDDDMDFEDYGALSRKDKDSINAFLFGLNTHGILVAKGILSLELVALFYQQFTIGLSKRLRRLVEIVSVNAINKIGAEEVKKMVPLQYLIWLLDKMDELPLLKAPE